MIRFVGVDPGKDGAIVAFDENGAIENMTLMPVIHQAKNGKALYDVAELARVVEHYGDREPAPVWFIEKQQPLPSKMGGSNANYSRGYGLALFEGILAAGMQPYHLISPGTWQTTMLRDVQGVDTKARAYIVAQRLFPRVDWRRSELARKPHDGLVDAALIGTYGFRWTQGTS